MDSVTHAERRKLFHKRLAEVEAHNAQDRLWKAAVNKFADYTDAELKGMLGYKRGARSARGPTAASSFLELAVTGEQIVEPKLRVSGEIDWRSKLPKSSAYFRDQGACGSCWAVAATGALEMQSELRSGNTTQLSYQQLVDCVENPQHCGGTGGCQGATAELAFEYVQKYGLGSDNTYSSGGACKGTHPAVSVTGWNRLPINEAKPLLVAVNEGPVVISVDGSKWFGYDSGIFDGCPKDIIVNHAVVTIGFGKEEGNKYWIIRNSWGQSWGEEGHIRLHRHELDEDYCGTDTDPKEGVGCDGGPEELPVCGMCGMLSDSSHPVGTAVSQ
jgi:cathepsin L